MQITIDMRTATMNASNEQPDSGICIMKEDTLVVKTPAWTQKGIRRGLEFQVYRIRSLTNESIDQFEHFVYCEVYLIDQFPARGSEYAFIGKDMIDECKNWIEDHEFIDDEKPLIV